MIKKTRKYIRYLNTRFFEKKLTRKFRMIYFSRITINSATQLMGLFLPIFLYQFFGFNLALVIIYYLLLDILYLNFIVLACQKIMNKIGIKRSINISIIFGAAYYFIFFIINRYLIDDLFEFKLINLWWLFPIILCSLFFRLTYWIPFHTQIAKFTDKHIRASQLSLMEASMMSLGAIMPIIAGIVLEYLGYSILFLFAMSIYLIAILPLSHLPKITETFTWSYKKTWQKLLSNKNRSSVLAYIGDGAESIIGIVIWPIFIWQLLEGNYFQVGAISSLIIIVTMTFQILSGDLIDKLPNKRKWIRYGSIFYSIGWILKALVGTAFHVFIFSTYHNLSRVFSRTSFDTLNYDIAADQGHYVDEYTVIRESAILIGKIAMAIIILILVPFFAIRYLFILAALASLLMSFLKHGEIFKD